MDPERLEKPELTHAVIESATTVLQDILTYRPTRGQIQIVPLQYTRDEITVVTRLSGDMTVELFFGMSRLAAAGVLTSMLGRDIEHLGSYEVSALAELGGLISEGTVALLEDQGALCYSTWAGVILGRDERATIFSLPALAAPLRLVVGELNVNIMLEAYAPFAWASQAARIAAANAIRLPAARQERLPIAA